MKYRRLVLALCLVVPASFSATAASVVMVQFGSFESVDEAQKRLASVKSTHADVLGSIPAAVREVKLPPDNLTVYRTQAGPIGSRAEAQALCSKLATSGDECYVVETAVPGTAVASAAPATLPISAAPVTTATPTPTGALTPPVAPLTPAIAAANALPSTHSLSDNSVINTAPPSGPALAPLAPVAVASATPAPSNDMQSALDRAAAEQNNALANPTPAPAPSAQKTGFWSHVNPFGKPAATSTANAAPASALAPTPDAGAMPVPTPVLTAANVPPAPIANGSAIEPGTAPLTPPPAGFTMSAPPPATPMIVMPATEANPAPHLLPPPPPLTNEDRKFLEANGVNPPPAPMPIGVTPPAPAPASIAATPANGNVEVEEAKHVPLTETTQAPVVIAQPAPGPAQMPSATLGQRTLWAQVGQFKDVQTALAFWDTFRQTHPDFPMVRVRVASSLQQVNHGNDKMWLRVGPFAHQGFINNLCNSVQSDTGNAFKAQSDHYPRDRDTPAAQKFGDLRCGMITDLGLAGAARPTNGYLSGSRYAR